VSLLLLLSSLPTKHRTNIRRSCPIIQRLIPLHYDISPINKPFSHIAERRVFNPLVVPSSSWWLVGMLDDLNSGDAIKAYKAVVRQGGISLIPHGTPSR